MLGNVYRQGLWQRSLRGLGLVIALIVVPISLCVVEKARSQETTVPPPLQVGVYVSPPFVTRIGEDTYSGMAIDLWTEIARRIGVTFEYREYETVRDVLQDTAAGTVDVAVTNVTITRNRAEVVAFTQPWYDGGLRILVRHEGSGGFWDVFAGLETAGHLRAYVWLALVILAATVGMTLFDRKFDPDFPRRWREGLAESFHHVMSIATSGRAPRKNLFGWVGRIWQSLWLVVGVAVIAYITSSVTSVMTAVSLTGEIIPFPICPAGPRPFSPGPSLRNTHANLDFPHAPTRTSIPRSKLSCQERSTPSSPMRPFSSTMPIPIPTSTSTSSAISSIPTNMDLPFRTTANWSMPSRWRSLTCKKRAFSRT